MGEIDRLTRVNELLKREIARVLERRILEQGNDFVLISVTEVKTSVDLRNSTVFISVFGDTLWKKEKMMKEIERIRPLIQKDIAKGLKFKHTPVLAFKLDQRMEKGDMVIEILNDSEKN